MHRSQHDCGNSIAGCETDWEWPFCVAGGVDTNWKRLRMRRNMTDEEALLAVCSTTYRRIKAKADGNVGAVQLAIAEELRRAGYELDPDHEALTVRLRTVFAVLADGRSVHRDVRGSWQVQRDFV
jgi:hypothetical protein